MKRLIALLLGAAFAAGQGAGPKEKPHTDWRKEEGAAVTSPAAQAQGRVVYRVGKDALVCRKAEDGDELWRVTVGGRVPPVVHGDQVWLGLQRFGLADGKQDGDQTLPGEVVAPPAFSKEYAVCASTGGGACGIELATGAVVWTKEELGTVRHSAAVMGNRAFLINGDGRLYAFGLEQGRELWRKETSDDPSGAPLRVKQHLYVPLRDSILVLEVKDAKEVTRIGAKGLSCPLRATQRHLFFGTRGGVVVRLDTGTNRESSRLSIADEPVRQMLPTRGKFLYGVAGRRLFAVHVKSWAQVWIYDGKEAFTAPCSAGGGIYVAAGRVFSSLR